MQKYFKFIFQIYWFIPTLDKQSMKEKSEIALKVILRILGHQNNKIWPKQWKFSATFRFMPNDLQNRLNNKWLPWKQNKRYLVHFMFSVSLKNTLNSLQNFKSLSVRVPEIMGGGGGGGGINLLLSIRHRYQTSQYIFNSIEILQK